MNYREYMASDKWKKNREGAIERAGGRCQLCNASKDLQVHHRTYRSNLGEEADNDLTVLCSRCHKMFTFEVQKPERKRSHEASGGTIEHAKHWLGVYSARLTKAKWQGKGTKDLERKVSRWAKQVEKLSSK